MEREEALIAKAPPKTYWRRTDEKILATLWSKEKRVVNRRQWFTNVSTATTPEIYQQPFPIQLTPYKPQRTFRSHPTFCQTRIWCDPRLSSSNGFRASVWHSGRNVFDQRVQKNGVSWWSRRHTRTPRFAIGAFGCDCYIYLYFDYCYLLYKRAKMPPNA